IRDLERVPASVEKRPWGRWSAWAVVGILAATVGWYVLQPRSPQSVAVQKPITPAATAPTPVKAPVAVPAAPPPEQVAANTASPAVAPPPIESPNAQAAAP